jgi:hypothetical protein
MALSEASKAGPKPFFITDSAHPQPVKFGATGDDPHGWKIDPTTGALVAPSGTVIEGVDYKPSADAVSTTNQATLTGLAQTIDTVALNAATKTVWLFGQTTTTQDGCYHPASGAWTRCTEASTGDDVAGAYFAANGSANKGVWLVTNAAAGGVIGTNDLTATNLAAGGGGGFANPATANLDFASTYKPINVIDPTSAQDLSTRAYVDARTITVFAKTTAALPAYTYANGSSGVGATITINANGAFPTLDGGVTLVANDPIAGLFLLHNGAAASDNGVYMLTTQGSGGAQAVATRYTGLDQATEIPGSKIRVRQGRQGGGGEYEYVNPETVTMGTTALFWKRVDNRISPNEGIRWFEDFTAPIVPPTNTNFGTVPLVNLNVGTGAGAQVGSINSATIRGVETWVSGTTATGEAGVDDSWTSVATQPDGGGSFIPSTNVGFDIEFRWNAPVLSSGAQEFALNLGLSKQRNASQTLANDYLGFLYDRTSSVNIQCVNSAAGTSTATKIDSGTVVTAGQWYRTREIKYAGSNNIYYSIDGVLCGGAALSANIPSAELLGMLAVGFKSVGTTTTSMLALDYIKYELDTPIGRAP